MKENYEDPEEIPLVMTICKSSTDEYLNADCMVSKKKERKDEEEDESEHQFDIQLNSTKIKAQEIDLNFPCIVANVGLSRIMIQSLTNPDKVSTFDLHEATGQDFICFASYLAVNDIGFKDKREETEKEIVPFSETGDMIAFLGRKFGVCGDDECDKGDMLLNVLCIDSYSTPMRFELYTTTYEACMNEGMGDDSI